MLLILAVAIFFPKSRQGANPDAEYIRVMNTGKNYLDQGQATNAIPLFARAVQIQPSRSDAHLNLANAYLLAGHADEALKEAQEALNYDRNSAAAYYVCLLYTSPSPRDS